MIFGPNDPSLESKIDFEFLWSFLSDRDGERKRSPMTREVIVWKGRVEREDGCVGDWVRDGARYKPFGM